MSHSSKALGLAALALSLGCSLMTSLDGLGPAALQGGDAAVEGGGDGASFDAVASDSGDPGPKPTGDYLFSHHWATNGAVASIARLPGGGFVVAGKYQSNFMQVGPYFLPAAPSSAALIVTLDAKGGITSASGLGAVGFDAVAATSTSLFVSGWAPSGTSLNGTTIAPGTFIAKLSRTDLKAAPAWVRVVTGTKRLCPTCLRANGSKVVALADGFGTIELDPQHSYATADSDVVLASLDDATGATGWAGPIGSAGADTARGLALGADGTVHAVFIVGGTVLPGGLLGASPPSPIGSFTMMLASFDAAGKYTGVGQAFGDKGGGYVNPTCIDADSAGNVVVGGSFTGGVDFGSGLVGSKGGDGFVLSSKGGKTTWTVTVGGNFFDSVAGCAIDPWGHVVATGVYSGAPTYGSAVLPAATQQAFAIFKLSQTGTFDWARGFLGRDADGGTDAISAGPNVLAIGLEGNIAVGGGLLRGVDFVGGVMWGSTEPDAFVAGFKP